MFKRALRGTYRFLHHSQIVPGQTIFDTKTAKFYKICAKEWSVLGGTVLHGVAAFGRNAGAKHSLAEVFHESDNYFYEINDKLHWSNIRPSPGDVMYVRGIRVTIIEHVQYEKYDDAPHRPPYYICEDDYCHRHTYLADWRRDIRQIFYPVLTKSAK